jgi:hypothetical protein
VQAAQFVRRDDMLGRPLFQNDLIGPREIEGGRHAGAGDERDVQAKPIAVFVDIVERDQNVGDHRLHQGTASTRWRRSVE